MILQNAIKIISGSKPFLSDGKDDVYLGVLTSETGTHSSDALEHAVEDGSTIASHVVDNPSAFSLSLKMGVGFSPFGALLNYASGGPSFKTVEKRIEKLHEFKNKRKLLKYSGPVPGLLLLADPGRSILVSNLLLLEISESRDNSADWWNIDLSLKKVKIANSTTVSISLSKSSKDILQKGNQAMGG